MAEAVSSAGELLCDAWVDAGIVARVGRNSIRAQQVRQTLRVGDVGYLRRHDGARLAVELVAGPVRVIGLELIDLVVVLAHEQRLQSRERGILLGADIAR